MPSDAVMDRTMFKAERSANTPVSNIDVFVWFISLVQFASCKVKLSIVLDGQDQRVQYQDEVDLVSFRWVII